MCRLELSAACQESKNVHTGSGSRTIQSAFFFSRRRRERNKYSGEAAVVHTGICLRGSRCQTLSLQGPAAPNAPMLIDIPIKEASRAQREREVSWSVRVEGWSETGRGWGGGAKVGRDPRHILGRKKENKIKA